MSMCIHGQDFESCSFGCTLRKVPELRLENDKLRKRNAELEAALKRIIERERICHRSDSKPYTSYQIAFKALEGGKKLCKIYFDIAAECIGENAVREKRDKELKGGEA